MCGGTADTDLDSFEEVSLEAKGVMSDAQEESQNEYKESETTEEETPTTVLAVSYTHLTLPTICSV